MRIVVSKTSAELGSRAAAHAAVIINSAIATKGSARIILSTGASQFETLSALIKEDIDWTKVEMFHLDEYVGLSESHPASFRKYLKERFVSKLPLKAAHFVNGEGNVEANIAALTAELTVSEIDLGIVGIGENGHIAFNDPPADFDTKASYITVNLDDACKKQQVGEGWFATLNDVPKQAITMTPYRIMQCRVILTAVPYQVKAKAIHDTLTNELTNRIPATILKFHSSWTLFIDSDSASLTDPELLAKYR